MISPHQALTNLYRAEADQWHRYILTPQDKAYIKAVAEQAAWALNAGLREEDYLKLIGMDMLLDVDANGKLIPLVLEANPRPSGLAHSWLLDHPDQPGVTNALFRGIRRSMAESTSIKEN